MKTIKFIILVVAAYFLAFTTHAQQIEKVKVGTSNGSQLNITNPQFLANYFKTSLGNSGSLGDYEIIASPTFDRFTITYRVIGNTMSISAIGLLLVVIDKDVYIINGDSGVPGFGGSIEYSCTGDPCNSCYPSITFPQGNWFPSIKCNCSQSGTGNHCNMSMTSSISISL
jgi:hypothetical protein